MGLSLIYSNHNLKKMKLISLFLALSCAQQQNDTDFHQRNWEESVVRAEKVIVLYREIAKKALYCKMMEKRRPKFVFRFRKTILDVTWHVKNKCNKKRSRRSVELPDGDFFSFDKKQAKGKGKGKLVFDYEEFDEEGFDKMEEEVDNVLFDLFVADYMDAEPVFQAKPSFSKSARSMPSSLPTMNSDIQKRVNMVTKAIKTTRKTAYSIVKEFANEVSGKDVCICAIAI